MKKRFKINKNICAFGGTSNERNLLKSILLSALLSVPCVGVAADISGPIASDIIFNQDTKVIGTNGVKTSSSSITIDASSSKLTLDNTDNGIAFSQNGQKFNIKAKELNIIMLSMV